MNFNIVLLKQRDLNSAAEIFLKAFKVSRHQRIKDNLAKFWNELHRYHFADFFAARIEDRIVGVGALIKFKYQGWISFLGIDLVFQNKKIGTGMLQFLMKKAKNYKFARIKLNATDQGRKLYAKFDFKPEYRVIQYDLKPVYNLEEFRNGEIRLSNDLPRWGLQLDNHAFGDDRKEFFQMMINSGAKIIICNNLGFGLVLNGKLGPVVAENYYTARKIVKFSTVIGARKMFVTHHQKLSSKFLAELIEKNRQNNYRSCTRMTWGKILKVQDQYLFGAHSFAFG